LEYEYVYLSNVMRNPKARRANTAFEIVKISLDKLLALRKDKYPDRNVVVGDSALDRVTRSATIDKINNLNFNYGRVSV
jgi:hypothetical protein